MFFSVDSSWATPADPSTDPAALRIKADILFKRILLRPNDLDAAFQYAEIETALGDFEAAIGSLERMLFYNPHLPRVRIELGILYFRLGSYAMAQSYFASLLAEPDLPTDVRERVSSFEAEIAHRTSTQQFMVFAQTGLRYQSNANAGPNSSSVRALGAVATLSSDFRRKADGNAFVLGSLQYIYDLDNQRGDVWETNAAGYYAAQFTVRNLNLGFGEVDTGPRFGLGTGLSVRPYVLGGDFSLGDSQYFGEEGGGVSLRYIAPNGIATEIAGEGRARQFSNSAPYPTATDQSGDQAIVPLTISGPTMLDGLRWQTRLSYVHDTAVAKFYAYDQFGLEIALPYQFTGFMSEGRTWTIAPFASVFDVHYGGPEALIDPSRTRHDHLIQIGSTIDMRIRDNFGFGLTTQYIATLSNIPNFRTNDFIVSAGPTFRF